MPTFAKFSPGVANNAIATVLPVFGPPRVGSLWVWSPSRLLSYKSQEIHYQLTIRDFLKGDHTPSGPTLGGLSTDSTSTIAVALLGSPGENVTKVGTILPLTYHSISHEFVILNLTTGQTPSYILNRFRIKIFWELLMSSLTRSGDVTYIFYANFFRHLGPTPFLPTYSDLSRSKFF